MEKLREFGRKAIFVIRVISGYEERKIRSYRLQLEKRLQYAKERKEALRKIPEQAILSEVRRMVEEMQAVNKKLEETESAIIAYFKPIDKEAEIIMNMQLEGEERNMRAMSKAAHERVMEAQALAEGLANAGKMEANNNLESESRHQDQASK
ncbi:uncharacterized protein LOC116248490 [Nymphaea colorata]|nr:uncharacterized protein LOC116248490 [Nymphaea colorata]XP_031477160.1 uncharacterized protein LOC116248490 [Nymphaea colorata]XP_031477161.1 uncharacterized protein LOC116248490 [Nymphaea colorata]XP_031477162.1 uncharacterized protein LOC116248490 [Nymphaea colorata]XP_031477163.1 uncharacterized protein LOC116248490 [Nymphaea colorata]XP_031477164.1 uncharacterized protein LOC116248490 [Nymphaea colorata]XP_031477165.1 uncharacterized protein LOC116248490 [Nymphaea colorata]XP_03147716